MTLDEQLDIKLEKQMDRLSEATHEELLHRDLEYALDKLGLGEIATMIEHLCNRLSDVGHDMSYDDIVEELKLV